MKGNVDGIFGEDTKNAIRSFQAEAGLAETGVADTATQRVLFADDTPSA